MKFWVKIFLCTLIIFEIFFVPSSIYLINSNFKLNLKSGINSGISENNRLCSSIESNVYLLKIQAAQKPVDKESIDSIIIGYLGNLGVQDVFVNVKDEENQNVFNNFKNNGLGNGLNTPADQESYIIKDVGPKTFLFIKKNVNLASHRYNITYIKDISSIYGNQKYLFSLLMKLNLYVSVILIIVMIMLSKILLNPINRLIKSTKLMADGNFSDRVKIVSDDEIGLLSKNYNAMADVIEDKMNQLEKNAEDKQRFIDNLSHELRTPLTSIMGYADYLRSAKYNEEIFITSLSHIYNEGKRLEKLSSKLMELINLRKEDFKLQEENIEELLINIKNSLTPKLAANHIHLELSTKRFHLLMDKDLMEILIINLVDNAIKASKHGDKIYIRTCKDLNSNIILEVKDEGAGIPEEDIPKVLEPFFMVDKSRTRASNGVGLGLSLCSEIAKIHNAKINIESDLGKGTIITVIFNH
jgi:signal transduction histidine kinase